MALEFEKKRDWGHPLVDSNYDWTDRSHPRYQKIAEYLKRGVPVADSIFDKIYPDEIAKNSGLHWTPVKVGIMAAKLLCGGAERRVLDVGSGCGKFCLVASLTAPGQFIGVERRTYLSEIAKESAIRLGSGAKFANQDAFDVDWSYYDAFYFYNPFYEVKEADMRIDSSLDGKGLPEFSAYVTATTERLSKLRSGTRVVTYHGFGGVVPTSYELVQRLPACSSVLNLWVKRH